MTAKQLFHKSFPFCMAKLGLGAATVLIDAVLLAILLGIGWLFGDTGLVVCFLIWCGFIPVVRLVLMHYVGYLVKAGHIAVIAEACKTGQFPANQVAWGKSKVKERFVSSNVYFALDKLMTAAIKQIQDGIQKVAGKLDFIPGMDAAAGLAKFFVDISLGYIDECCLGWTFYHPEQSEFKSAADGVVIYAQNWKPLLKNAAITMLKAVLGMILIVIIAFVPIGLLFKLFKWNALIAFVLACLIAWVIKFAFFDSYIMCQMMASYMQVAPTTVITFDLYSKLCAMSRSFKQLFEQGQAEQPQTAADAEIGTVPPVQPNPPQQNTAKPIFCGECGTKNEPGTKFCGGCGAKLS
ncbi:MAG: zinc ribbon domain-containing protein [Clostridia bacterium]|nr:zinc ribbon domain-containing protein [Clostridia bacterium]